jgi:cyclopropane-fatty-acyl-phospholipid synthase
MSDDRYLDAARRLLEHVAEIADAKISVKLWDGSVIPLGDDADPNVYISIRSPGVLGAILRWPTVETMMRQYACGGLDYHGRDLMGFIEATRLRGKRSEGLGSADMKRLLRKKLRRGLVLKTALRFLLAPGEKRAADDHRYRGNEAERDKSRRDDKAFVQFHYDLSNEFYGLFLDPEMQYSCGYFTDWENDLARAQQDKLDMICRKLRLEPGERFLDIGCGWGGLLCHAVRHFGVEGHGVTLSRKQFDFATEKVRRLGLEGKITIELRDFMELKGPFDKISSIGMYEHVGILNYPKYFSKMRSLLRDRGIFLNHGITRRAKANNKRIDRSASRRLILKYIFPGSELDNIGHTVEAMEACGFEIHDVEGWREHYALTARHWCQRLEANKEAAIAEVGEERLRMWLAYLAGVSFGFTDGSLRLYQVVATKQKAKGPSGMPPTREDLYRHSR